MTGSEGSDEIEELAEYDADAQVLQLYEMGQRVEIMLDAAGGMFEFGEETPTDLPAEMRYQRGLTELADKIEMLALLRKVVLRDEDDADKLEEAEEAGAKPPKKS